MRSGPGVYIVQMQPGFESITWSEIVARIPRAKKLGTRTVPERAGMLIFEAPRKEQQVWFLLQFGPDCNLGNIAAQDVLSLETLRLGLRSETVERFALDGER